MTDQVPSGLHTDREIRQQPRLWRELAVTLDTRREELAAFLRPWMEDATARVVLTGAGTSAYAGQVLAPWLSRRLQRRVEAIATTDLVAAPHEHLSPDVPTLLVSFARSGQSPESVAATELAEQVLTRVGHLIITCNPDGHLARAHERAEGSFVLVMPEGSNDQSFAMTSSFTSMTLAALVALGGPQEVEAVAAAADDLLARRGEIEAVVAARPERVVYLGSGALLGLAEESALKLLELTAGQVVAWAESSLGFRHGPKAILTPRTLVVVYLSNDPYTRRYDLDIVTELVAQLGPEQVLVVDADDRGSDAPQGTRVGLVGTAGLPDPCWGLAGVLVAQLVGQACSLDLGLVPDNPFPTGEVNRVVRGVTVHPLTG
ncbi:SIS domain-containing protein [Desertihabitans brevis]|uniref:SIS domain-containing protein n=1 Tax=Desertihabitans brevis TaxID=2268447 RepID=A0A367YU89_9ACTN|nr:SIS domain-containing protein [Desertihabitans brevis]RCK69327.1 SIS domain-containing protein [Desertihabitans brevis]